MIYHGGLAGAGGAAAGYGLPNDLRVLDAVGARTGTYSNILKLRYDSTFRPIADAVFTDADRSTLRFEDIRDEVMFVRMFDSLGPQFVTGTKQPIAEALRENASVANQIRSMLLSLWGHRYLIEHGYLDRRETASLYSAFLIEALARARGSLGSPAARARPTCSITFSRPVRFLRVLTGASRSTGPPPTLTLPGQQWNSSHPWQRATRLRSTRSAALCSSDPGDS